MISLGNILCNVHLGCTPYMISPISEQTTCVVFQITYILFVTLEVHVNNTNWQYKNTINIQYTYIQFMYWKIPIDNLLSLIFLLIHDHFLKIHVAIVPNQVTISADDPLNLFTIQKQIVKPDHVSVVRLFIPRRVYLTRWYPYGVPFESFAILYPPQVNFFWLKLKCGLCSF